MARLFARPVAVLIAAGIIGSSLLLSAQTPDSIKGDLDLANRPDLFNAAMADFTDTKPGPATDVKRDKIPHTVAHLIFRSPEKCAAACKAFDERIGVVSRFESFADILVRRDSEEEYQRSFGKVLKSPGLAWIERHNTIKVPPPPEGEPTTEISRAIPESIVRGGQGGLTGKNVIIAVVDSGIDFRHPDFITVSSDGTKSSRLLYLWDTMRDHVSGVGEPGPLTYPGGVPIGTVFSRDDLNHVLRGGDDKMGSVDDVGHGTACAGVAAGNGGGNRDYVGVAPQADLIAVRIGGSGRGVENSWLLNSICGWIDEKAGKRPAVISCSFGGGRGGRDGASIEEQQLARRIPSNKPGRLVCIAVGNEGNLKQHATSTFSAENDGKLTWEFGKVSGIEIFVDPVESGSTAAKDVEVTVSPTADTKLGKPKQFINPLSGSRVIQVSVEAGSGGLYLKTTSDKKLRADAYLYCEQLPSGAYSGKFTGTCVSNERQIACPATAPNVIAVGSFDFNDRVDSPKGIVTISFKNPEYALDIGGLSRYSNAGPDRLNRAIKPDIAAPGQFHVAPASGPVPKEQFDSTRKYRRFNGTSAATPYTAGVAALLMEANPSLSADDFRRLLKEHATKLPSGKTGECPNPGWGNGKLDVDAVERMIRAVR